MLSQEIYGSLPLLEVGDTPQWPKKDEVRIMASWFRNEKITKLRNLLLKSCYVQHVSKAVMKKATSKH